MKHIGSGWFSDVYKIGSDHVLRMSKCLETLKEEQNKSINFSEKIGNKYPEFVKLLSYEIKNDNWKHNPPDWVQGKKLEIVNKLNESPYTLHQIYEYAGKDLTKIRSKIQKSIELQKCLMYFLDSLIDIFRNYRFIFYDIHDGNICFDGNHFRLIDYESYIPYNNFSRVGEMMIYLRIILFEYFKKNGYKYIDNKPDVKYISMIDSMNDENSKQTDLAASALELLIKLPDSELLISKELFLNKFFPNFNKKLFVIRHSERMDWEQPNKWLKDERSKIFPFDTPITQRGKLLARSLRSKCPKCSYIYVSPMTRCIQTAVELYNIYNSNVKLRIEPGLWFGMTKNDLPNYHCKIVPGKKDILKRFPVSIFDLEYKQFTKAKIYESKEEMNNTYSNVLKHIINLESHNINDIVIVAHMEQLFAYKKMFHIKSGVNPEEYVAMLKMNYTDISL